MIVNEYTYKGVYVQVNQNGLHQVISNDFPCFSTKTDAKRYIDRNCGAYHYEWLCRCDNLAYGGMKIGTYSTRSEAYAAGQWAGKGCFIVKRVRVNN